MDDPSDTAMSASTPSIALTSTGISVAADSNVARANQLAAAAAAEDAARRLSQETAARRNRLLAMRANVLTASDVAAGGIGHELGKLSAAFTSPIRQVCECACAYVCLQVFIFCM